MGNILGICLTYSILYALFYEHFTFLILNLSIASEIKSNVLDFARINEATSWLFHLFWQNRWCNYAPLRVN